MSQLIHDGEQYWTLHETDAQRRQQAQILRAIYALADPDGYDARKLRAKAQVKVATKSPTRSR